MHREETAGKNGQLNGQAGGLVAGLSPMNGVISAGYPAGRAGQDRGKNARLEEIVTCLLVELGVDVRDQHFHGTAARVARLYRELTRGYSADPVQILKTFESKHSELIIVNDIGFHSLCPHHLAVYRGKMHFAYVPDGKIVGLSKIPRLIQTLSARMIVQEDLVSEIADGFMEVVKPLGCAVKATGKHDCVAVRGVKAHEASMTTVAVRGVFKQNPSLIQEFHHALDQSSR